jgi:uncharacterized protein DUF2721
VKKSKSTFGARYGARAKRVLAGAAILLMSCGGPVLAVHGAGRFASYWQLNTSPPTQDAGPSAPSAAKPPGPAAAPPSPPAGAPPPAAPPPKNSDSKRVDLGKFVSVATTPVGLIIAGAIILSFFEQKRGTSSAQVRALVHELRAENVTPARRLALIDQVNVYKSRLASIRLGSQFVAATLVLFIITNVGASLGLIWPDLKIFDVMVVGGMLLGMLGLAASLGTEMYDSWHSRKELNLELQDFDRVAQHPEEKQKADAQPRPAPAENSSAEVSHA